MSDTATIPIEDLVHDLTISLWRSRGALREFDLAQGLGAQHRRLPTRRPHQFGE
jgi:hypothetical protein